MELMSGAVQRSEEGVKMREEGNFGSVGANLRDLVRYLMRLWLGLVGWDWWVEEAWYKHDKG